MRRFAVAGICLAAACAPSPFPVEIPTSDIDRPGDDAWQRDDPTCETTADCPLRELCLNGVCQLQRCSEGPYVSTPPLGLHHTFLYDRELIIVDASPAQGAAWVDGYASSTASAPYAQSWSVTAAEIVDLAGGNLDGDGAEDIAAALKGEAGVSLITPPGASLAIGFEPVAIAAGDVDGDRVDEVIALSAVGEVAVCHFDESRCELFAFPGEPEGLDVAVADFDADRYDEPVFLLAISGDPYLYMWNFDAPSTGQSEGVGSLLNRGIRRITAGDLDGDGYSEVAALEDGGWWGWANDALVFYGVVSEVTELGVTDVNSESVDLALVDINHDRQDELAILRSDHYIDVYQGVGPAQVALLYSSSLTITVTPSRIDGADFDDNSPRATLVAGPELIPGNIVPVSLLHMPPYDREHSQGLPYLYAGSSRDQGQAVSDSMSLRLAAQVGFEAGLEGVLSASVGSEVSVEMSTSRSLTTSLSVGDRYTIEPDPAAFGPEHAAVILSGGCFHGYTYEIEDASGTLGPPGAQFMVVLPVGGQSSMWSLKRYNAMAAWVGGLPIMTVESRVGEPASYPAAPVLPGGAPIPSSDLVFPRPPSFLVSDIGSVGWTLSSAQSETNEMAQTSGLSFNASLDVAGFTFGGSVGSSWGHSYSVTVGTEASFAGGVPPIPDDRDTPEDEYALYRFTFSPLVYRQHYTDAQGSDAAFYVMSFMVGR